jgi:hypothetical protein
MAIRLKLNGLDIETDSAKEAVEMYRYLSTTNGHESSASKRGPGRPRKPAPAIESNSADAVLDGYGLKMVKLLLNKRDGEDTEVIAREIGVNGPKGLASPTRQVRNWASAQFSIGDECVLREKRSDGRSYTKLSDALIQKIRGHEKELFG